ncbi:hypothetical protein Tco_0963217, partial [Tanacetum coccineum]
MVVRDGMRVATVVAMRLRWWGDQDGSGDDRGRVGGGDGVEVYVGVVAEAWPERRWLPEKRERMGVGA